ncbi:MAG TPA: hypothetical protein VIX73_11545 [Kofleriaceae bacterium]
MRFWARLCSPLAFAFRSSSGSFDAERSSRLFHIGLGFGRYLP